MINNTLISELILGNIDLDTVNFKEQQKADCEKYLADFENFRNQLSPALWNELRNIFDAHSNHIYSEALQTYAKCFKFGALLMLEILDK